MVKVLPKMQHKPWIPVQDDALWHAKNFNHMLIKQVHCFGCSGALMHRYQYNSPNGSVYYFHDIIESM